MSWLDELTPQHIRDLVPYSSARREASEGKVWLNANENPFPRSEAGALNRYPDFQPQRLIQAYASYAGVQPKQLLVTRGIDEGIDLLNRAFCQQGVDQIMFTPPTYGMYDISAKTSGLGTVEVPLGSDWQLDVETMIQRSAQSKLIYVCSPNNPTGNLLKRSDIIRLLEGTRDRSLVVLDEAYIEFSAQDSLVDLLSKYRHLIVLRTMSKAFGLAGLRCGFVLAAEEVITTLQKVSAPYPIPVPVVDRVSKALSEDGQQGMKREVDLINQARNDFLVDLNAFSFVEEVIPSVANFVLFRVKDAEALMSALSASGVIIRNRSSQYGLANTVRATIGTPDEMQQLILALKDYEDVS
jgi:histidinol-phosphate aminotransferase